MTQTLTAPSAEYGADALIVCDNLVRIYQVENIEVQALQGLDLLVDKGEMIAIVGQSGSGKSTLLNVLSGLDVPTAGAARVAGWDLLRMTHADRLTYRRSVVGFVWQQTARNLLPYLNARENVMLPMAFSGLGGKKRIKRADELLATMGMADKATRRPGQLSGGEQQRVAIAVALANEPEVIFADEPTGELDSSTGDDVFEALRAANRDLGATVVVVTHDHAVSSQVQRTVAIRDGRTATEVVRRTHVDEAGVTQTIHEEYAVLDRAGRMQLPKDYRDSLELKDRVRLELEDDHIGVWNDQAPRVPKPAPAVSEPEAEGEAESDAASTADDPAAQSTDSPAEPVHDDERFAPPAASAATAAVTAADAWSHSRPVITPPTRDNESAPVSPAPASAAPNSAGEQAPTPADDAGGKRVRFEPAPERPSPQVQSMLEPGAAAYEPYMQGLDDESTPYQPRIEPREPEETPNQSVSPATAPVDPAPNASSEPDGPSDPVASPDQVAPSPPVAPSQPRPPAASPPGRPVSPYLPTEPAAGNEGALPPSRRERREALEAEGESPDGARPPRAATDPATPAHDPDTPVDQPRRPAPRSPWLPVKEDDDE